MTDPIHKHSPRQGEQGKRRSVCGEPGWITHLWVRVTCPNCQKERKS